MKRILLSILCAVAFVLPAWPVSAQAPINLSLARVMYNSRKATVKPQGALKDAIDALDRELNEAWRLGRTGEARRLIAKGLVLLSGGAWTDALDYASSLVLRTDRVFVDTTRPYAVRLEQTYLPSIALTRSLVARVAITRPGPRGAGRGAGAAAPPAEVVKDLGTLDGVSRDLRDTPVVIDVDLAGLADGPYRLRVQVLDGETSLGTRTLDVVANRGLDERLRRLEAEASQAPEASRAEALYPADHVRLANLGRIPMGTFDLARELARAEQALPAVKAGEDPYDGRTGDLTRHYLLRPAGEIMPYRVWVPTRYDGKQPMPLVVALHGLGGTEDAFFDSYARLVPQLAEQRGYLVAAPLGYRVDGGYGSALSGAPGDAQARRAQEYSEQDVMAVLQEMRQRYRVDESRIYLMGHSMGGIGTWRLGATYPDIWAALAPISGFGAPATVEKMRHIPQIVVHGDADPTVSVAASRAMVAEMKRLGVEVRYIEVPGGNHADVVVPNLPAIFDFFDAHRRRK
jgi:poly(3-hydroxybutyrate) depolymerase